MRFLFIILLIPCAWIFSLFYFAHIIPSIDSSSQWWIFPCWFTYIFIHLMGILIYAAILVTYENTFIKDKNNI